MLPTALGFHKSIKVTDYDSVLATEAIGFSQEYLLLTYNRSIFMNRKLIMLYIHIFRETTASLEENLHFP